MFNSEIFSDEDSVMVDTNAVSQSGWPLYNVFIFYWRLERKIRQDFFRANKRVDKAKLIKNPEAGKGTWLGCAVHTA